MITAFTDMYKRRCTHTVTEKQKRKFGHYVSDDEEMIVCTTVSGAYLRHKFFLHFLLASIITLPISLLVQKIFDYGLEYTMGTALILALLYAVQRYYFTREGIQYILTNKKLAVQIGYFQISLNSASYNKVTHLEVEQNFMERLFLNYGKITVHTAGSAGETAKEIVLEHVASPVEFKNIMERLIHSDRSFKN